MQHLKYKVSNKAQHSGKQSVKQVQATADVQTVLVLECMPEDEDTTTWWPSRWPSDQTSATLQPDATWGSQHHESRCDTPAVPVCSGCDSPLDKDWGCWQPELRWYKVVRLLRQWIQRIFCLMRGGAVLLECETGNPLDGAKQMVSKQNKQQLSTPQIWYSHRDHQGPGEVWTGLKHTFGRQLFPMGSCCHVNAIIQQIHWVERQQRFFVWKPDECGAGHLLRSFLSCGMSICIRQTLHLLLLKTPDIEFKTDQF